MPIDIRDFYRKQLDRTAQRVDTSIVLQMQRIVALTIDEIFVPLTCRTYEDPKRWANLLDLTFESPADSWEGFQTTNAEFKFFTTDLNKYQEQGLAVSTDPALFRSTPRANTPIEEVLSEESRVVLLGDPGSGKSTLLRWLVHRWALAGSHAEPVSLFPDLTPPDTGKLHSLLPVPLTLRDFAQQLSNRPGLTLAEYLRHEAWNQWPTGQGSEVGEFVHNEATKGECLFLFDGLDEAIDAGLRARVVDAIETLIHAMPACHFVVTSRVIGYELAPMTGGFSEWALEPFKPNQTQEFFHKWALAVERHEDVAPLEKPADDFTKRRARQRADEILQGIGIGLAGPTEGVAASVVDPSKRRLQDLAQNPMLCTLIGLIHHQGKRLPEDRCELYRLCLEAFIYDWEIQKRTLQIEKQTLHKFESMDVLEELAFHLHEKTSDSVITLNDLRGIIQQFLEREKGFSAEAAAVRAGHQIDLIHGRAGLLIERGEGEFGFSHLQFQEYLAGRAITRRRSDVPGILQKHLWQTRWQEPILLAAGHRAQHSEEAATEFLEAILATPPPEHDRYKVDLEALLHHALFTAGRCLHDAKRVHFKTRDRIVGNFSRLFSDERRSYLWTSAAQALQRLAAEPAVRVLAAQLKDSKKETVRESAAQALGALETEEAVEPLSQALRNDPTPAVRWAALASLQAIPTELQLSSLLEALQSDGSTKVRKKAAAGLGALRGEGAVQGLIKALHSDPNAPVRRAAARALGVLRHPDATDHIIKSLRGDTQLTVRVAAAQALGAIGSDKAVDALLEVLTSDANLHLRSTAAVALGAAKAHRTVSFLIQILGSDVTPEAKVSAAEGLAALGAEQAVGTLEAILTSSQPDTVRRKAALALGRIRAKSAVPALLNVLTTESRSSFRGAAALSLGAIGGEETVAPLFRALRTDQEASVRRRAARALGGLRSELVVDDLLEALRREQDPGVRKTVLEALQATATEQSIPTIVHCLNEDSDPSVRRRAAKVLGALRSVSAVGALKAALLTDLDALVRGSVAQALGAARAGGSVPALLEAARSDPELAVRWRAVRALGVLRSREPVGALASMLADEQLREVWPPVDTALREILYD